MNDFFLWTGIHPALCHLSRASINNFVPLCFRVRVHGIVKAGDELMGKECPVLFR